MPVGSNLAGVARVAFQADTGQFNAEIAAAEARYSRTTATMSDDAIRMSLAQDKLNRALSRFGPESRQAQTATLALRSAQRQTSSEAATLSGRMRGVNTSSREAGAGLRAFTRDVERAGAGAAIGSRAIRGLRSVVLFGGGSVLGGFGVAAALRSIVDAAREQEQVQSGVRSQLAALGISYADYRGQIERTLQAQSKMSAFDDEDLGRSFTTLVRRTGDVSEALRLNEVTANIARGRHADLQSTADLLTKALNGNARAATTLNLPLVKVTTNVDKLRESGVRFTQQQLAQAQAQDKTATGLAIIAAAQQRYAGRAQAYANSSAGAQDRFNKTLQDTEEIAGKAAIPALTQLFNSFSRYLTKANESGQVQREVRNDVNALSEAAKALRDVFVGVRAVVSPLSQALGGTRHTVKLLAEAFIALKIARIVRDLRLFQTATVQAGRSSVVAAGEMNAMATAEQNVGRSAVVSRIEQYTGAVAGTGGAAATSATKVGRLRGALTGLNAISIAPIAVPIVIDIATRVNGKVEGLLGGTLGKVYDLGQFFATGGAVGTNPFTAVIDSIFGKGKKRPKNTSGMSNDPLHDAAGRPSTGAPGDRNVDTRPGFRDLPVGIQQALADAGLTRSQADDRAANERAKSFLERELRTAKLTASQRLQLTNELASVIQTIRGIDDAAAQKIADARRKAQEAAKRREAAARAAHLEVLGRRQTGIENRITQAQTREESAGTLTALRKAQRQEQQGYRDLIAFYNAEARDTRLTAAQRTAATRNAARARRDLTRAIVRDAEEARARREDALRLSVTNAQAALESATKGTAQWTKAKERLDKAYAAEIAFYNAEAHNEKLSLAAKAKARRQAAEARKAKAALDKGKGSQADVAALIREFLSEQRGLYAGASNVFTEPEPNGARSPGTTVVVNQNFNAPPTTDRHREARYARTAMMAAFDS